MAVSRRTLRQVTVVVTFVIVITLLGHFTNSGFMSTGWRSSESLKTEIRELSVQYVKQVIVERSKEESPYAPKESANLDMSRSLAVVLDILLKRTARLEEELERFKNCTQNSTSSAVIHSNNQTGIQRP